MSSNLPVPFPSDRPSRLQVAATRAQERTTLDLYKAELDVEFRVAIERLESEGLAEVMRSSTVEQIKTLTEGLRLAGDSVAARELVARLASLHSQLELARLERNWR